MSAASSLIGNLGVFDHNSQEWEIFYGRLKQFLKLNKDIKEETRSALLLTHLGDDTYRLARNLVHPKELDDVTYDELVTAFNDHFSPKKSTYADCAKFYEATRGSAESVEDWAARLRGLAIHCDFNTALDRMLTDRFVLGMNPGPERDRLFEQEVKKLTFAKAIEVARQAARARQARELITVKQEPVYRIGQTGGAGRASAGQGRSTAGPRCGICGMKSHQAESCRYKNYRCRSCGVKGHLVKVCKKKGSVRVNNIDVSGATSGAEENDNHKCEECELFNLRSVNYDPIFLSIQINNSVQSVDNDELPVVFNDGSNCASSPPLISAETSSPANSSAAQNDDLNTTLMPENILSDSNNETVESEVWEEAVDEDSGGDESLESVTLNEGPSSVGITPTEPSSLVPRQLRPRDKIIDYKKYF
ncbi:hypothetical protein NE865_10089 [Phthorimaea operculella]|nr:hypothetical protein NE865_10089 [Phthorimaea operculella]